MPKTVKIGFREIGDGQPAFIIAEIGINHNGDLSVAKKLIDTAVLAGCDAVKFQKRTPELCVPPEQKNLLRETPWGLITYLEYRRKIEFGETEYREIARYCNDRNIIWFASCWDIPSIEFMETFQPVCYKIASASLTDQALLKRFSATGKPIIMSTGMSTMEEIQQAVFTLDQDRLLLAHSTSAYPCAAQEINLRMMHTLKKTFRCPTGYSGHEVGLQITIAAVAMGACFVERHITLDRTMWGGDQAASVEPPGLMRLTRDIRIIETAMGDGIKQVYESEKASMKKLRIRQLSP